MKSNLQIEPPPTTTADVLSSAVLHQRRRRRTQKRVRFALKLSPVEEDSRPSSRETPTSVLPQSNKRIIDPWRQGGPLYGTYVEYLQGQDVFTSTDSHNRRTPPKAPPPPEPGAEAPTYTHTFVIQSKSPEIIVNSITVSTPQFHLPRILSRTKQSPKQSLPILDYYVKQQLNLSTSPRMIHMKKLSNAPNQKPVIGTIQAALKRAESVLPATPGLHANNRILRSDSLSPSKTMNEHPQQKKLTEIISKPLPGVNNQINHFSERSILPNYSKKARVFARTQRSNEEFNSNVPYFCQNHGPDQLSQPILHSTR